MGCFGHLRRDLALMTRTVTSPVADDEKVERTTALAGESGVRRRNCQSCRDALNDVASGDGGCAHLISLMVELS